MKNDLLDDIRSDKSFTRNVMRSVLFLVFLLVLDYAVSVFMEKGLKRFYGLESKADVLLVGHSHLMLALDKVTLEKRMHATVAKYTRAGVNVQDRYVMLQHYFSDSEKPPSVVVYGIDPWLFTGEGLSLNSYKLFYPFMDNSWVDSYIHREEKSRFGYYLHKFFRSTRFELGLINSVVRGYIGNWSNLKFGQINKAAVDREISLGKYRKITIEKENVEVFKRTLKFLHDKRVIVILLNTPVYVSVIDIQATQNTKVIELIDDVASKYDNVYFIDLSMAFSGKTEYFFDPIHVNPQGQKAATAIFSGKLDSLVNR